MSANYKHLHHWEEKIGHFVKLKYKTVFIKFDVKCFRFVKLTFNLRHLAFKGWFCLPEVVFCVVVFSNKYLTCSRNSSHTFCFAIFPYFPIYFLQSSHCPSSSRLTSFYVWIAALHNSITRFLYRLFSPNTFLSVSLITVIVVTQSSGSSFFPPRTVAHEIPQKPLDIFNFL